MESQSRITRLAHRSAQYVSHPWAVLASFAAVTAWMAAGLFLAFSDGWHDFISSTTALITFVMVFLIQNAQNRDTQAIQLKLDELIRVTAGARNDMIALERESEDTLDQVKSELSEACGEARPDATAASRSE
jgi:low affinity Fe/Cu permease